MFFVITSQTLEMSSINSCSITVLNITVLGSLSLSQEGISLFCHQIRLCRSDYSELNTQPAGENHADAYLCIFKPEYLNVEHSDH